MKDREISGGGETYMEAISLNELKTKLMSQGDGDVDRAEY